MIVLNLNDRSNFGHFHLDSFLWLWGKLNQCSWLFSINQSFQQCNPSSPSSSSFFFFYLSAPMQIVPTTAKEKGLCTVNNTCVCYQNFTNLDCSGYTCPNGTLWFDRAISTDVDKTPIAHGVAECAGHGTCNRDNGICDCDAAWTGRACERRSCPAGCSGNGICTSTYNLGKWQGIETASGGSGPLYTNWDGHMTYGSIKFYK